MLMTTLAAGALSVRSFASFHSLAMWQAQDSINSGNSKLLMIFIGIAAFALLLQAGVIVGVAIGAAKTQKEVTGYIQDLHAKAMPLIEKSHTLVTDLTPEVKQITTKVHTLVTDLTPEIKQITTKVHEISVKVEQISTHFEEIAGVAKDKVNEFAPTVSAANETVMDANRKTQAQIDRMNVMVTGALDATAEMTASFRHGITAPGRELANLANTIKHITTSFVSGTKTSVDSMVTGTKTSVDSLVHGTKGTVDSLLHGFRGLTASLFAPKRKPVEYRPAAYRSNPAVPNPPLRTGFADEPKRTTDY